MIVPLMGGSVKVQIGSVSTELPKQSGIAVTVIADVYADEI